MGGDKGTHEHNARRGEAAPYFKRMGAKPIPLSLPNRGAKPLATNPDASGFVLTA